MGRVLGIRLWASIGVLAIAAGMPYCSAALAGAATQDDTSISVRADIALGVLVSWIGGTILAIVFLFWLWKRLRRGAASGPR